VTSIRLWTRVVNVLVLINALSATWDSDKEKRAPRKKECVLVATIHHVLTVMRQQEHVRNASLAFT